MSHLLAQGASSLIGELPEDQVSASSPCRIAGERVIDIARHRGSRPRTLWDRRQRAEHTLVSTFLPHQTAV